MAKDMIDGEIQEYNGKKYRYKEIETMESDMNWLDGCCKDCCFGHECSETSESITKYLGNCYQEVRKDGRNGIFEELKEDTNE